MSLVGPRPETCAFWESIKWEGADILCVRPGMTSPASIRLRNEERILQEVEDPEVYAMRELWPSKVKLNREYIAHWSVGLDVVVMVKTVGHILRDLLRAP
jgi:lipopolysaccharide/colanic/teichoic acid biosynthesis glycosyltransferase